MLEGAYPPLNSLWLCGQGKRGEAVDGPLLLDGYEEDGNPPALGAGNTAFDSPVPDA